MKKLTHIELREARERLRLTPQECADVMEVDVSSVYKWERDPSMSTARPAPTRVDRLFMAYLSGWRSDDWPERAAEALRMATEARP